jgi:hypothetical protein
MSCLRYVLTRWVERLVSLALLTAIIMPHHAAGSTLRPRKASIVKNAASSTAGSASDLRSWTAIKLLKYGIENNLYKKKAGFWNFCAKKKI